MAFNTFFVSNFVKKNNSKVALSGLGADEIFYGYPIHKNYRNLDIIQNLNKTIPYGLLPNKYQKMEYLKLDSDYGVYLSQRGIFSPNEISQILNIDKQVIFDYIKENNYEDRSINNLNKINKMAYFEITKYMEGQLLRDSDVFGMSNSIEIRVPFLNQKLVEAVLSVNHKYKFDSSFNKPLLFNKYKKILPPIIYERKKQGFELPYKKWLNRSGLINNIINSNNKYKFLKNSHWSKIWAIHVLKN
jgi:asparagine synthase (glutamine-hydrolysing)